MLNINRVQLFGNLGQDPELTYTTNNTALAKVNIAVNRNYKDKNTDEWKEITTWLRITFWGKMAEKVAQMRKGEKVYIDGRLETSSWTDDQGKNHSRTDIVGTGFIPWTTVSKSNDDEDIDVPEDFDEPAKGDTAEGTSNESDDPEKMPF